LARSLTIRQLKMATYIKLCDGDCSESLPCGSCAGCITLQAAADDATTIYVSGDGIGHSFSTVETFTSYEESCGENATCSGSSTKCGVSFAISISDYGYNQANSYSILIGKNQNGDCGMTLGAYIYFIDGANSGDMSGSIFVPLTPFWGTYSIPTSGYITVNGETTPWNGTSTIIIS